MLKNYFTIALRNLRKHTGYTLINVLGLAVGLACCLLILLYVRDELSYDTFHEKADRTYRVARATAANTPYPLAPTMAATFPEVEQAVRLYDASDVRMRYDDEVFVEPNVFFADPAVFDVFTFPFVQGNPETALSEPDAVVLTETTAEKYFGEEDPMGKVLTANGIGELIVTGVVRDVPSNAHFHFDVLVSFINREQAWPQYMDSWLINSSTYTYVLLREGQNPEALEAKLASFVEPLAATQARGLDQDYSLDLWLQPLTDIHLRSTLYVEIEPGGHIAYVYLFSAIAVFILLIACVNFMNLTTARSAARSKEVGLRKTLGARRAQIMRQFLVESVLVALFAMGLAFLLAELTLPLFNRIAGKALSSSDLTGGFVLSVFLGLALLVGLLAGSYPAFFLSAFRPAKVLKGSLHQGTEGARLRKVLVVAQYTIAIALIAGTAVIYNQLHFIRTKTLGFDADQVVTINIDDHPIQERIDAFKAVVQQNPAIAQATIASDVPGQRVFNDWLYRPEAAQGTGEDTRLGLITLMVDPEYVETLGLQIVEGRNFSKARTDDENAFLINETAARTFGWDDPLGKQLEWYDFVENRAELAKSGSVIGVVKDFHFKSLHQPIGPIVLQMEPGYAWMLAVRLRAGQVTEGLEALKRHWAAFTGEALTDFAFLNRNVGALYRAEQRLGQIFTTFAGLALFIACLGLFGLATFAAERRTKEIGIRKVLGASVPSIVALLSKEFVKLVGVAFVVSAPVAYFAMNQWLRDFAYRIDLSWRIFLLAGLLALGVALLTVSYQAVKAALADPVKSLRYE